MLMRNGRPLRKTLKALTDPVPEFVSLVFGGANKTPFRALRADGATISETEVSEEVANKAETHAIARVEFAATKFADEAAVKAWLSDGGYDDKLPVTKTADGFLVDSTSGLDKDTILSVIDLYDSTGVKIYAVALKSDAHDEVLELTEKAEVHPGAQTPDEMAAQPMLLDLTMSLYDGVRECFLRGDTSGVADIFSQTAAKVATLTETFPDAGELSSYKAFIDAIAPEIEMSKETPTDTNEAVDAVKADETAEVVATITEVTEEVAEVTEVAKTDETAETVVVEEVVKTDEVVADATDVVDEVVAEKADETDSGEVVEKTAEPNTLEQLTALVGSLADSIAAMKADMVERAEKTDQRVAAIEDTRQTRKGADVDETSTASAKATVSDGIADLRTRNVLGMRRLP